MLEHVPAWLGHALVNIRAGAEKLTILQPGLVEIDHATLELSSPAFAQEAMMPPRFTADGTGVSPPLVWSAAPAGTASFALLVEDADAPALQPLVHAILWGIPADTSRLAEGAIVPDGMGADGTGDARGDVGRNSYLREGWLPPDPPTGHGEHRYAFQLFALDAGAPDPGDSPGRGALVEAMTGHVLAAGLLVGLYARGRSVEMPVARDPEGPSAFGTVAPA